MYLVIFNNYNGFILLVVLIIYNINIVYLNKWSKNKYIHKYKYIFNKYVFNKKGLLLVEY